MVSKLTQESHKRWLNSSAFLLLLLESLLFFYYCLKVSEPVVSISNSSYHEREFFHSFHAGSWPWTLWVREDANQNASCDTILHYSERSQCEYHWCWRFYWFEMVPQAHYVPPPYSISHINAKWCANLSLVWIQISTRVAFNIALTLFIWSSSQINFYILFILNIPAYDQESLINRILSVLIPFYIYTDLWEC